MSPAPVPQPVAILGAGPIGLDAALAAADRGWPFTVYEAAPTVGWAVREWGYVRMFTPWDMNVSPRMRAHLEAAGMTVPSGSGYPTGAQFAEGLLDQVAALPASAGRIELGARVEGLGREGLLKHEEIATDIRGQTPFRLLLSQADGSERIAHADLVLDCTGSYGNPNVLGDRSLGDRAIGSLASSPNSDFGGYAPLSRSSGSEFAGWPTARHVRNTRLGDLDRRTWCARATSAGSVARAARRCGSRCAPQTHRQVRTPTPAPSTLVGPGPSPVRERGEPPDAGHRHAPRPRERRRPTPPQPPLTIPAIGRRAV